MTDINDRKTHINITSAATSGIGQSQAELLPDGKINGLPPSDFKKAWVTNYADAYFIKSRQNQERRERRRARRSEPSAESLAANKTKLAVAKLRIKARFATMRSVEGLTQSYWNFIRSQAKTGDLDAKLIYNADSEPVFAQQRKERRAELRALVKRRMEEGFRSPGGFVGGNPTYKREPFIYPGLVSDEHPILKLFVASTPRASHLQTGENKAILHCVGQKLLALDEPYIDTNKNMRRVLRVEVDSTFECGVVDLIDGIRECGVPLPNIVVGYIDMTGALHNPHLIWLIEYSVTFSQNGQSSHQSLWAAVLRGLTAGLLCIGADPGGVSNSSRVKNPISPEWDRAVLVDTPYTLSPDLRDGASALTALSPFLDMSGARQQLQDATISLRNKAMTLDHPDPVIRAQSNMLFRHLSGFARQHVLSCRDQDKVSFEIFSQLLRDEALKFVCNSVAAEQQVCIKADKVAQWTWTNYTARPKQNPCGTIEERKERQQAGQAKGACRKRDTTTAELIAAALGLIQNGRQATQAAVALAAKKSPRTVGHHRPTVVNGLHSAANKPAVRVA